MKTVYENDKKDNYQKQYPKTAFFADEMTQLELAEKAGASRQTIVALEAEKYTPTLEMAFWTADAFGVPIGEVFKAEL